MSRLIDIYGQFRLSSMKAIGVLAPALFAFVSFGFTAELDLFVTDYNENPTAEQKPLLDQPLVFPKPQAVIVTTGDGKNVTVRSPLGVSIRTQVSGNVREAKLFATPGEYEPFSFLLRPKQALSEVMVSAGDLKGPDGAVISSANLTIQSVEGFHGGGRDILMPVGHPWSMPGYNTEYFWCTIKVPEQARPGSYKGELVVSSAGRSVGSIQVALDVLPIQLPDPPLSLGFNYSKPDDDKEGKIMAAHFADMRAHGMTCVAPLYDFHLPVYDSDTSELAATLEAYKRADFPGTFYWAAAMSLHVSDLCGYGDETTRRWQQKYIKVMRLMHDEAVRHGIPCLFSIGDELTNKGMEGVKSAGRLAKFVWEELPEIATTSDMNGYSEVLGMAPFLNVATFNNGWDGADHHNNGRRLLNKSFLEEVQKTGAIPWFVNAGSGRFPFGFFLWKMSHYGVKGKVEWYYNLRNEPGSLVRTQKDAIYPTLDYERCREGIDDLKYLVKLESLLASAKPALAEATKAGELLAAIDQAIADDWSVYEGQGGQRFPADGFAKLDPEKATSFGRLNSLRLEVASQILALQKALSR